MRLDWAATQCKCILDDIGMKLFSRRTSEIAFLQLNIYGTSMDEMSGVGVRGWNDVNNVMDIERALHNPMAVVQRFIPSMMRRRVGAWGMLTEVMPDTE